MLEIVLKTIWKFVDITYNIRKGGLMKGLVIVLSITLVGKFIYDIVRYNIGGEK